jgi:hypothetical protein
MFDFIDMLTDATHLASAATVLILALRTLFYSVSFGVELFANCVQKAKSAGFTPKALLSALANFTLQNFDVIAPAIVLASGIGVVVMNLGMLAFVPDLTYFEVVSAEGLAVAIIWRAMEAFTQHVQRKREALKPAWKPQKKG